MATFDISTATPVASTDLAAGDRFAFDDVSDTPDSWDVVEADDLLDGLLRIAGSTSIVSRSGNTIVFTDPSLASNTVIVSFPATNVIRLAVSQNGFQLVSFNSVT